MTDLSAHTVFLFLFYAVFLPALCDAPVLSRCNTKFSFKQTVKIAGAFKSGAFSYLRDGVVRMKKKLTGLLEPVFVYIFNG